MNGVHVREKSTGIKIKLHQPPVKFMRFAEQAYLAGREVFNN